MREKQGNRMSGQERRLGIKLNGKNKAQEKETVILL